MNSDSLRMIVTCFAKDRQSTSEQCDLGKSQEYVKFRQAYIKLSPYIFPFA